MARWNRVFPVDESRPLNGSRSPVATPPPLVGPARRRVGQAGRTWNTVLGLFDHTGFPHRLRQPGPTRAKPAWCGGPDPPFRLGQSRLAGVHGRYAGVKPPPPGIQPLPAIAGSVLPWTFLDRAMAWSSLLRRPRASLNALGVKGGGKVGHVSGMVAKLPAGGVSPSTPPIPVLATPLGERDQGNREARQKHLTPMVQAS